MANRLDGKVVIKAQIHAGGRGKGGGVKIAENPKEAEQIAKEMIGMTLVTAQTGSVGQRVSRVLVEEALDIDREVYLGLLIDRSVGRPVFMASSAGGMEIEKVAAETPELILNEIIQPENGLTAFQARRLAFGLDLEPVVVPNAVKLMQAAYTVFCKSDASLVEINPLILTRQGTVCALDAKVTIDDSALFRQSDLSGLRDIEEEDPLEVEASKFSLNYIRLDGTIGCMVNGAGLAMATMDIIKLAGAEPANFLDVGGGASAQTVENGFHLLLSDPNVKAILINIFGGIVRCDRVAEGVIQARQNIDVTVPVVVRLAGTNADVAAELLEQSELSFAVGTGLKDAAEKVAAAIQ